MGNRRRVAFEVGALAAAAIAIGLGRGAHREAPSRGIASSPSADRALRALALRFEPNVGQFDSEVQFGARGSGFEVRLGGQGARLGLRGASSGRDQSAAERASAIDIRFEDADPGAQLDGVGEMRSVSNYFIGRDPAHWHSSVPNFGAVRYRGIYPGIDVLVQGGEGKLEYDFEVSPGANPELIRIAFEGVDQMSLSAEGDLLLQSGTCNLRQPRPGIFQKTAGRERKPLVGDYVIDPGHVVHFHLEPRSPGSSLLIDPVLVYSTYLGGSGSDTVLAATVDSAGSAYVTGQSGSSDFPLKNPFQTRYGGGPYPGGTAFVTKFDPTGAALVFSTYLGGNGGADGGRGEQGNAIAVDDGGAVYIAGFTDSSDFPVTAGSYQVSLKGSENAFFSKLAPAGQALTYSTYLGGSGGDRATGIALDESGRAFLCGGTTSADFPLKNAVQTTPPRSPGRGAAFVSGLDPAQAASQGLVFSSFLAGNFSGADAIAVDGFGRAYVSGFGLPPEVIGGVDAGLNVFGAFVVRLADGGTSVDYARTIGEAPSSSAEATALVIDRSGAAYIAGNTNDIAFPTTASAFQANTPHAGGSPGDDQEAFVAKLSSDGATWEYATYLGGSADTYATGIALAPSCASNCGVTVVGNTISADFPTVNAVAAWGTFNGGNAGGDYLSQLDATASTLTFSTPIFLAPNAVTADSSGNIYVGGTPDPQMILLNPFQVSKGKIGGAAAVAKFGASATGPTLTSITPTSGPVAGGTAITLTGGYFGSGGAVSLGGVSATGVQLLSATQMSAVTGPHAAGLVDVTVTNLDGQTATLTGSFSYMGPPPPDAGPDAGTDAGPVDAGGDAGFIEDAGMDAGQAMDSGGPLQDAGPATSGSCGCGEDSSPGNVLLVALGLLCIGVSRRRIGRLQSGTPGD